MILWLSVLVHNNSMYNFFAFARPPSLLVLYLTDKPCIISFHSWDPKRLNECLPNKQVSNQCLVWGESVVFEVSFFLLQARWENFDEDAIHLFCVKCFSCEFELDVVGLAPGEAFAFTIQGSDWRMMTYLLGQSTVSWGDHLKCLPEKWVERLCDSVYQIKVSRSLIQSNVDHPHRWVIF